MKLIIDIPEEVYKTVQDGSYCGSLYEELLAAIPYNPIGELISRSDALKAVDTRHEELLHDTEYRRKHCQIDLLGIKKHILAIPPVETFTLEDMQNNFDAGVDSVIGKYDKAEGEWINHRNDYGHNIADCSLCGKTMQWHDEDEDGIPRYCWYCGAKMKCGAE